MNRARLLQLQAIYRTELYKSVIPFWLERSLDRQRGDQFNCLDRDGSATCSLDAADARDAYTDLIYSRAPQRMLSPFSKTKKATSNMILR